MTTLPRPLRKWRQQLEIFPDDIATGFGSFVARLAPAFAGLDAREAASGEVDGYDGIASRGSYERLLSSEWALQRAAPLEFLRRAADSEQAFLALSRKERALPRGSVVLFDAGPDQIGAPRVVQLATLVLLYERATSYAHGFGWQLLHHVGEALLATVDRNSVSTFLSGRTALRSTASALRSWRERFPAVDLWIVGSRAVCCSAPSSVSRVEIGQRVDVRAVLDVLVVPSGRAPRTVALQPPPTQTAVRLLRDPFQSPKPALSADTAPPAHANLLLNPQGSRVFYGNADGQLLSLAVPSSPRHTIGAPRKYAAPSGTTLIGVGQTAKKLVLIGVEPGTVAMRTTQPLRRGAGCDYSTSALTLGEPRELWPVFVYPGHLAATFVAGDRSLWHVNFDTGAARSLADGVRAVAPLQEGGGLVVVDHEHETVSAGLFEVRRFEMRPVLLAHRPMSRAFLRLSARDPRRWVLARQETQGPFLIRTQALNGSGAQQVSTTEESPTGASDTEVRLHAPSDSQIVGVDLAGEGQSALGLYAVGDAGRELFVVGRGRSRTLVRCASGIVQLAIATRRGLVAYVSGDGELGFVERSGKLRWRGRMDVA